MFYIRTADRLQRTAAWLEALDGGLDHLRAVIVDDSLGHLRRAGRRDGRGTSPPTTTSGAATLEDPERLRRFVSFVNAPDAPDPSIAFAAERGQTGAALGGPCRHPDATVGLPEVRR